VVWQTLARAKSLLSARACGLELPAHQVAEAAPGLVRLPAQAGRGDGGEEGESVGTLMQAGWAQGLSMPKRTLPSQLHGPPSSAHFFSSLTNLLP
jgi:hypothetical protein